MHLPNSLTCFGKFSTLTFSGYHRTIPYNSTNNLPIIFFATDTTTSETSDTSIFTSLLSTSSDDLPTPDNLSTAQRKLLHIHQKFGHLHFVKMQYLARSGFFRCFSLVTQYFSFSSLPSMYSQKTASSSYFFLCYPY